MIRPDHPTLSIVRQCRLVVAQPFELLSCAPRGESAGEPRPDGRDRPSVPGDAVLRCAADDVAPAGARASGEHQAGSPPDAAYGSDADLPAATDQRSRQGAQGFTRICCAACASTGPTRCGAQTSPTSHLRRAFCIWWRSWTGGAARFWRGVCRTPWTSGSASMRWMRRWAGYGSTGDLQHRSGQPVHVVGVDAAPERGRGADLDGRARAGSSTTSSSNGCGAR